MTEEVICARRVGMVYSLNKAWLLGRLCDERYAPFYVKRLIAPRDFSRLVFLNGPGKLKERSCREWLGDTWLVLL